MAQKQNQITTPVFRVSFPAVFEPTHMDKNAAEKDKRYKITMIFDKKTDISSLKKIALDAAVGKWGADKTKWPKGMNKTFRDGAEKDTDGFGDGVIFCSATSKMRPGLVDGDTQPIIDQSEFYGGCYARATVTAFAYVFGKQGVTFGLRNIQKVKDGELFSSRTKAEEDFDSIKAPANDGADSADADLSDMGL